MIKRLRFATARAGSDPEALVGAWRARAEGAAAGPEAARPVRSALCRSVGDEAPRHHLVGLEWFTDADHLARFEAWRASVPGRAAAEEVGALADPDRSPLVVADEHVLRGEAWLRQRWVDGGVRLKHVALARRAGGLTPEAFSRRWRAHAGTVGGAGRGAPVAIPAEARGLAYVQDHPRPRPEGWAYDAVNEVYVDGWEGVRRRTAWFEQNVADGAVDDLFGPRWALVVEEEPLWSAPRR